MPLRVLDVQEKEVGAAHAPTFPTPQAPGFPQPRKRSRFASTFKQQRQQQQQQQQQQQEQKQQQAAASAPTPPSQTTKLQEAGRFPDEKASIDRENRERLQNMGVDEIEEARKELLSNLDPALLQMLLRRANLDEGSNAGLDESQPAPPAVHIDDTTTQPEKKQAEEKRMDKETKDSMTEAPETAQRPKKSVSFAGAETGQEEGAKKNQDKTKSGDVLLDRVPLPTSLAPISSPESVVRGEDGPADRGTTGDSTQAGHDGHDDHDDHAHNHGSMHFPQPPTVPDLDPADPDFLANLHAKYFPNLPADPARLAWMAPVPTADSPADRESPYYPGQATVAVSQLRFDFRGRLVPPRASRAIPVSKGLHHHGEAPEAAGYTVAELARLARSAVPAQRCVAFQTLGRLLYRLGRGEWGGGGGGGGGASGGSSTSGSGSSADKEARAQLALGIWRSVREGRVLDTLHEAAAVKEGRGHRGSRAYAIEAIWLYEKGGWKEQLPGR